MASYRAEAVDTWLRQRGWEPARKNKGSHRFYHHPAYRGTLQMAYHGTRLEPWQMRNLLDDLRRIGAAEGERENGENDGGHERSDGDGE